MPPLWMRALSLAIPARYRDEVLTDLLDERARQIARGRSRMRASLWLVAELLLSARACRRQALTLASPGDAMLSPLVQDVRYALRYFRRRPGFTAVAVITLTLGIGVNLAAFAVIHATLLRPLPFPDPDAVVGVFENEALVMAPANYVDLRDGTRDLFTHFAAYRPWLRSTLSGLDTPMNIKLVDATPELFGVIGVAPLAGRVLTSDDLRERADVVVIAQRLWRSALNGDPAVVGRRLTIDGRVMTIVGVMPEGIALPDADAWRPLLLTAEEWAARNSWFLNAAARLAPGVDIARADAAAKAVMARANRLEERPNYATVRSLHGDTTRYVRDQLVFAQGISAFVLIIACANLANLLLASYSTRRTEIAIRLSIGASRVRVVRQMLVESLVLAAAGGGAAIALARWLVPIIVANYPGVLPRREQIGVSVAELAFTIAIAAATAVVCSTIPAITASSAQAGHGARRTAGRGAGWLRPSLLVAEVALALMLLAGAGLLVRSLAGLVDQRLGFDPDRLLTTELFLPPGSYADKPSRVGFYAELIQRLQADPAIASAGGSTVLPFGGADMGLALVPDPPVPGRRFVSVSNRSVIQGYFETMGMRLVRGRTFTSRDDASTAAVAVVNEAFVRTYSPDRDVFTTRLRRNVRDSPLLQIVGVVGDVRPSYANDTRPEMFFPVTQDPPLMMRLVMRLRGPADGFGEHYRTLVQAVDSNLVVPPLATYDAMMASSIATRRFNRALLVSSAALAVLLAAVGISGVMSYTVSLRRREVGVRLALGARPADVVAMIVRQGLAPIVIGLALGLAGAWWLTSLLTSQLYRITPHDPLTLSAATAAFLAVALLACWIPARRTSRVDPASVLRAE